MAQRNGTESAEIGYHSLSGQQPGRGKEKMSTAAMEAPVHPVATMQGAFEESIVESIEDSDAPSFLVQKDAQARRQTLLESEEYDDTWLSRWKQKSTARYHPLLKLMAQIVFGMHLLQQRQAKSDEEVVKILQSHVNEVDSFLERTAEDFDLAIRDIEERIRCLKLPMGHLVVFETMLEEPKFRTQLLDGNAKIETIIERTSRATNATLLDVQHGYKATKELGKYLDYVRDSWPLANAGIADVYGAMRGNEQGWKGYLKDLHSKGKHLGKVLVELQTLIREMSEMAAAAASRKNKTRSNSVSATSKSAPTSPDVRSKFSHEPQPQMPGSPRSTNLNKPLPSQPDVVGGATQVPTPKPHPVPFAERYERPRQSPSISRAPAAPSSPSQRPKTAGSSGREPRAANARETSFELAAFLQRSEPVRNNPNPLRSHPPDDFMLLSGNADPAKDLVRSHSQGADLMTSAKSGNQASAEVTRSRSQGTLNVLNGARANGVNLANGKQNDKEQDKSIRPSIEQNGRKDSGHSTGFARRLSKRMKHLPTAMEAQPKQENVQSPPPDSAYSSGTDKVSPPRRSVSPLEPTEAVEESEEETETKRPESLLGPLPSHQSREPSQSRPSGSSVDSRSTARAHVGVAAPSMTSRSFASTSKSKAMSFRNFFRNKRKGDKLWSGYE